MRKFKKLYVFAIALIILVGCNANVDMEVKNDNKINSVESESSLPPQELVDNNIENTDVSIAFEVTESSNSNIDGIYITYILKGTVFKSYKGDIQIGEEVIFYKTIEYLDEFENINPFEGKKMIASFNYSENGQLLIPDVAYDFNYSNELNEMYEKTK
jgi:hypothetical protein